MNEIGDIIGKATEFYQAQLDEVSTDDLGETARKLKRMESDLVQLISKASKELENGSNAVLEGRIKVAVGVEKKLHFHAVIYDLLERGVVHEGLGKLILEIQDVNARNEKDGSTALMYAAHKGTLDDVLNLLQLGADPCIYSKNYQHALKLAVGRDDVEVFRHLSEFMARLDFQDSDGCTVVHIAAARGKVAALEILKLREDWNDLKAQRNYFGDTPFDLAVRYKMDDAASLIDGSKNDEIRKLPLYGRKFIDISQSKLESKLKQFIGSEKSVDVDVGSILPEGGQCNGWAFLQQYYFAVGKESEYKEALETIAFWDGNVRSLQREVNLLGCGNLGELLRDLVNHLVVFFALSTAFYELETGIQQEERGRQYSLLSPPSSELDVQMINCSLGMLADVDWTYPQLVELLEILQSRRGVVFDFGIGGFGRGHRTSLAVTGEGKFHYYDSNHRSFLVESNKPSELVGMIYRGLKKLESENVTLHWNSFRWGGKHDIPASLAPKAKKDSPNGFADLHVAALCGDIESCRKLLAEQGDVSVVDNHGNMAIDYACMYGYYDVAALFVPQQREYMISNAEEKLFLPETFVKEHLHS